MEQEILGLEKKGKKSFGRITKDIIRKLANLQITLAKVLTSILLNLQLFECKVTNQTSLVPEVRKKITSEHSIDFKVSDVQTHPSMSQK